MTLGTVAVGVVVELEGGAARHLVSPVVAHSDAGSPLVEELVLKLNVPRGPPSHVDLGRVRTICDGVHAMHTVKTRA